MSFIAFDLTFTLKNYLRVELKKAEVLHPSQIDWARGTAI